MKAAVVTDLARDPIYTDFREPEGTEGYVPVTMLAAAVHQLVRSVAKGAHYSSGDELPLIPGVDGVGLAEVP